MSCKIKIRNERRRMLCASLDTDCRSHTPTVSTHILIFAKMKGYTYLKKTQTLILISLQRLRLLLFPPPTAWLFTETPRIAVQSPPHASLCSAPLSDPMPTQELWSKRTQTNTLFCAEWSLLDIEKRERGRIGNLHGKCVARVFVIELMNLYGGFKAANWTVCISGDTTHPCAECVVYI